MKSPKVLFIGGTLRGLRLIEMLLERKANIVRAYILKEDPHEPIKVSQEIEGLCSQNGIPCRITNAVKENDSEEIFAKNPDVAFVCGWRTIIPKIIYSRIPEGCLAAHDSLLPKYRGFCPTCWAVINGEGETGVTLFKIDDKGVDAGEVFGQRVVKIASQETSEDIYPRIVDVSVSLYSDYLDAFECGNVKFFKQDETKATYGKRRTPADGQIDWNKGAKDIYNFIRALQPPYPYAWIKKGEEIVFVKKASLPVRQDTADLRPGFVKKVFDDKAIIACKDGFIEISQILDKDGNVLDIKGFFKENTIY